MNRIECDAARDNIDAHAIGALDAEDTRALEAHMAGCSDCTALAVEAQEGGTALALSVPLASSGPALKARVLASASILSDVTRSRRSIWWQTAAAALVALSVGGLAWGVILQRRVNTLSDRNAAVRSDATAQSDQLATVHTQLVQMTDFNTKLADAVGGQDAVLDIVSQPDVRRVPMSGTVMAPTASGRYIWSETEDLGALVATNLPSLPEGESYQMWVVYQDHWVAGGSFATDATGRGQLIVRKPDGDAGDEGTPLWFCVTIGPASGQPTHTGTMVLRSTAS